MDDRKTYDASDFERYHAGDMTPKEMHEMEKSALADPFVARALEGYGLSQNPTAEIRHLESRLNRRIMPPVVNLKRAVRRSWWIAAAAVFLVAGSMYFLSQRSGTDRAYFVSENKTESQTEKQIKTADTSRLDAGTEPVTQKEQDFPLNNEDRSNPVSRRKNAQEAVEENRKEPTVLKKNDNDVLQKTLFFKREDSSALSASAVEQNVMMRRSLEKSQKISDTTAVSEAVADALRFKKEMQNAAAKKTTDTQGRNSRLSGPDTNIAQLFTSTEKDSAILQAGFAASLLSPAAGWQKYREYLSSNGAALYHEGFEQFTDSVILSFSVSKSGIPRRVKVLHSSFPGYTEKAIRLLQRGPRWKATASSGSGQIIIYFGRKE